MAHLLEPTHNPCFVAILDRLMPQWRFCREQLNRLPVRHDEWVY
jgi:predicted metal-dependent hydrolase